MSVDQYKLVLETSNPQLRHTFRAMVQGIKGISSHMQAISEDRTQSDIGVALTADDQEWNAHPLSDTNGGAEKSTTRGYILGQFGNSVFALVEERAETNGGPPVTVMKFKVDL